MYKCHTHYLLFLLPCAATSTTVVGTFIAFSDFVCNKTLIGIGSNEFIYHLKFKLNVQISYSLSLIPSSPQPSPLPLLPLSLHSSLWYVITIISIGLNEFIYHSNRMGMRMIQILQKA